MISKSLLNNINVDVDAVDAADAVKTRTRSLGWKKKIIFSDVKENMRR